MALPTTIPDGSGEPSPLNIGVPIVSAPSTGGPASRTAARFARAHTAMGRSAAGFCILVSLLVLVGWARDIELFKSLLHPARIPMNPVSAVGFILCSLSLWLLTAEPISSRRRRFAMVISASVFAIACAKLVRWVGYDIGVDRILFPAKVGASPMAPNSAITFALVAMSLLMLDRKIYGTRVTPILALGALAVSLLALLGYAYDLAPLYQMRGDMAMALNTAVCFYILALGLMAVRPEHPPLATLLSDTVGGLLARRLLPAAVLAPALVGYAALVVARQGGTGPELAVLIFTLTTIVVFVGLTAWTASRLHRLDVENRVTLRRLQRAEAVYHSLVQTLPQNVFRKDLEGRFTFGNRHFCQTLNRTLDQIIGRTDFDFYGPELAARYRHDDLDVAGKGRTMDVVEEHVTPAGDRLYVQVIKTPVRGPEGQVMGVQGIFWDVTDRVVAQRNLEETNKMLLLANNELGRANDELANANARLEKAVAAERAAMDQLTRTQTHLVQSEKMVGLGQMVAGVAHEINNPLAFVTNNVAVLQRDVKALASLIDLYRQADETLKETRPALAAEIVDLSEMIDVDYTRQNLDDLLARSREGLRRIQQIVRDLRDFARLDESDLQTVNINDGIESTVNIILGHAKKKQIKIEKDLGELPPIVCYPAKINQVIMNLVGNAIDASNEGGCVRIRTRSSSSPSGVVIEVTDQGCGIDSEVRERIFDPFFTTKPIGQGTGLGLSISYGIVRDHGGTIEVDSELGKGSTFRVTLPAAGPSVVKDVA